MSNTHFYAIAPDSEILNGFDTIAEAVAYIATQMSMYAKVGYTRNDSFTVSAQDASADEWNDDATIVAKISVI